MLYFFHSVFSNLVLYKLVMALTNKTNYSSPQQIARLSAPVASGSDTTSASWRTMIAVLCVQLPSGHASSHGHGTGSAIEASVRQARVCGTVCHRTYEKTRTSRVSSINWKHLCLGIRQPRRIVTVAVVRHRNTLTYLIQSGPKSKPLSLTIIKSH